jgi:hypothetical protein
MTQSEPKRESEGSVDDVGGAGSPAEVDVESPGEVKTGVEVLQEEQVKDPQEMQAEDIKEMEVGDLKELRIEPVVEEKAGGADGMSVE